jgi:hypothetical protein
MTGFLAGRGLGQVLVVSPARDGGQTTTEYVVALGVITVGIVAALTVQAGGISEAINNFTSFFG